MINETRMRCFLTLAESLSFTETAKRLYMTQQGVSKHIANIEKKMGFPLFVRSHHTVSLTAEGERCYQIVSRFMHEYEPFLASAQARHSISSKILRIGYQDWLDYGLALDLALDALRSVIPNLEITGERHSPSALRQLLLSDKLDLILIHQRFAPPGPEVNILELCRSPMVVMVSKDHPRNSPTATYQTFSDELFLIDALENESPVTSVRRGQRELQSYGLTSNRLLVLPNRESAYNAAKLGQGVIVGSSMAQALSDGILKAYPTKSQEILVCAWKEGKRGRLAEQCAQLLQQEYCKQAAIAGKRQTP